MASGPRGRLRNAALELFVEHGFAATTVDAVAARAGVTQRTFFRHVVDKEEVLFDADEQLLAVVVAALRAAPAQAAPREVLLAGLTALAGALEADRDQLSVRDAVLRSDPALAARDLVKAQRWANAVEGELAARGVTNSTASALAAAGAGAFRSASTAWLAATGGPRLETRVRRTLEDLRNALAL